MTVLVLAPIAALATGAAVVASSGASTEPASRDAKVEVRGESVTNDSTTTSTSAPVPTTVPATGAGSSAPAPAPAPAAPAPTAPQMMILVCETGVTIVDGIETSSQTATRVPVGTPVPPGCWIG